MDRIEPVDSWDDEGLPPAVLKKPSGLKSEQDLPVSCTLRLNASEWMQSDTMHGSR